jgi:TrpR-related protein YerC/YecD
MKSAKNKTVLVSLFDAMASLRTADAIEKFLKDLCTPTELKAFNERWIVAQLLDMGQLSYRDISKQTGTSTTTISRVARFLAHESYSGYRLLLNNIKHKK